MKSSTIAIIGVAVGLVVVVGVIALFLPPSQSPSVTGTSTSQSSSSTLRSSTVYSSSSYSTTTTSSTSATSSTSSSTVTTNTTVPTIQYEVPITVYGVVVDEQDSYRLAQGLAQGGQENGSLYSSLSYGEFIVANISLLDNTSTSVTVNPSDFLLVTTSGEYECFFLSHSIGNILSDFQDLREAGICVTPIFSSPHQNVTLNPQGVERGDLVFLVPNDTHLQSLDLQVAGKLLGHSLIQENRLSFLKIITLKTESNDSRVTLLLDQTKLTYYTTNDEINVSLKLENYHAFTPITFEGLSLPRGFTVTEFYPEIVGEQLTPATVSPSFPSLTCFSALISLPNESYSGYLDLVALTYYKPSFSFQISSVINDTAEAIADSQNGGNFAGDTFLVMNVSLSYSGNVTVPLNSSSLCLVTTSGNFSYAYSYEQVKGYYHFSFQDPIPTQAKLMSGTNLKGQLIFVIPLNAKPLYLVYHSSNGIVMSRVNVPLNNVRQFVLINKVCLTSTNPSIAFIAISREASLVYGYAGGEVNVTLSFYAENGGIITGIFVSNNTIQILSTTPNVVNMNFPAGKIVSFKVTLLLPSEGAYYNDLDIILRIS